MTIDRLSGDPAAVAGKNGATRPTHAHEVDQTEPSRNGASGNQSLTRTDQVEISSEGRALSASVELSPERLLEIQGRLADGTYHSAEVAEKIAARLLSDVV